MNMRNSKSILLAALLASSGFTALAQQQQALPANPAAVNPSCGPGGCISANEDAPSSALSMSSVALPPISAAPPAMLPDSRPPVPKESNFGRFVQDSLGHALPTFGHQLFLNAPSDFQASTSISAPSDYLIGTGDQIRIRGFGSISIDVQATVDRNGQIYLPQVGPLNVAGLRADQLQGAVQHAIDAQYKNVAVTTILGRLRSIQIFVLGHAVKPGVYTISSLSTLVNALFASGGPTDSGTLRDIQLKRDDQVVTHFDVYRLLMDGDKSKDVHLLPGDVIFIPVVGPQVAVDGEVKNPAIYELAMSNSIEDVIQFAGGLTPLAEPERASLLRITKQAKRVVQDFPLNGAQNLIPMQGGDILRIFPLSSEIAKSVTIRGSIAQPGLYPWHAGMRVSDLLPDRKSLISRSYYNKQNSTGHSNLDHAFSIMPQQEHDSSSSQTRSIDGAEVAAAGSAGYVVKSDDTVDLASHDTEINWNYAIIERLNRQTLKTEIISFKLGEALDNPASPENKVLEPGDVITLYTGTDINLPTELRARFVRIDGEVLRPGVYEIGENETLQQVLNRAGGPAPHAYLYASQLTRESVRITEESKLQNYIQQATRDATSPMNNNAIGADGRPAMVDLELRKAYIRSLQALHPTGRIRLQLSPAANSASDLPDFPLQDKDHFFVPPQPNTVDVIGSVFNQGAMRFLPGKHVQNYLMAAGGNTREGDKSQEFVLRADGSTLSRKMGGNFEKTAIFAGDTIIVPARMRPGWNAFQFLGLGEFASSIALTAVALSTLQ